MTTSARPVADETCFSFEEQLNQLNFDPIPVPELQNNNGPYHQYHQPETSYSNNHQDPVPTTISYTSSAASVVSEMTTAGTSIYSNKRCYDDSEGKSRTVNNYDKEEDLFHALLSTVHPPDDALAFEPLLLEIAEGQPVQKVARYGEKISEDLIQSSDWILPRFDPATTEPQTVPHEMRRLQTLQKYFVLDSQRDAAFDRITALASRIFDAPISLISLIDLGRQWFLSSQGAGDTKETPRKWAFCARTCFSFYAIESGVWQCLLTLHRFMICSLSLGLLI